MFWNNLQKPILALAPMAGITDSAFRQICFEFGADVLYSEMVSATALFYGSKDTIDLMKFDKDKEPNYIVQLFGSDPKHFEVATKIVTKEIKPDGIDINFGCPVPKVAKQGAGAELMRDFQKAKDVIKAVVSNTDLPVAIKTRTKVGEKNVLDFLEFINDLDIKALMIHGRTLAQGFGGEADTETIKKARDFFGGIILANGGINNLEDAKRMLDETGADGLGLARGILGRPWLFENIKNNKEEDKDKKYIFDIAMKHAELMQEKKGDRGIVEMRKHLCWYVAGLPGARAMREKLVHVETLEDIKKILK